MQELMATIRERGLRATSARVAVFAAVVSSRHPASHAEIVRRLAKQEFDRATVFRNLATLVRAGLVRRIDVGDHVWRFVANAEREVDWGATFECTRCGKSSALQSLQLVAEARDAPRSIARREVEIVVRGPCDACA